MAKDKLFSTSMKPRRTPPGQVTRTTNPGNSSFQAPLDTEPFDETEDGLEQQPAMTKTGTAPASPTAQRPKTVGTSGIRTAPGSGRGAVTRQQRGPGIVKTQKGKKIVGAKTPGASSKAFYGF